MTEVAKNTPETQACAGVARPGVTAATGGEDAESSEVPRKTNWLRALSAAVIGCFGVVAR